MVGRTTKGGGGALCVGHQQDVNIDSDLDFFFFFFLSPPFLSLKPRFGFCVRHLYINAPLPTGHQISCHINPIYSKGTRLP